MLHVKILYNDIDLPNRVQHLCNLFLILVQYAICHLQQYQSSVIILVINYEIISDSMYVTALTFGHDILIYFLFSFFTFDLDLIYGVTKSREID